MLFVCAGFQLFGTDPVRADTLSLHGQYSVTVGSYDWGPAADGVLLALEEPVCGVAADSISVTEVFGENETVPRTVRNAFLSDKNGNAAEGPSAYIYLELCVDPSDGGLLTGSYNSTWNVDYEIRFSLNSPLEGVGTQHGTLQIEPKFWGWNMPQSDRFLHRVYTSYRYDVQYRYAAFLPESDDHQNPLIVWLHGGGEGGRDSTVAVMGNRACALTEDPIQNKMGGAYVLVPQCPTYWMDGYVQNADGSSVYTQSLMELIRWYVKKHPDIDPYRIYIGGLSNGGYMTMEMLLAYPEYFAAGFPICSGYEADTLTEKEYGTLAQIPLWFLYAETDTTVDPALYSGAVVQKLRAAGAQALHVSSPEYVSDTTGRYFLPDGVTPYRYDGHMSWICALNSAAYDDEENTLELFSWLSAQRLAKLPSRFPAVWVLTAAIVLFLCTAGFSVHCIRKKRKKQTKANRT